MQHQENHDYENGNACFKCTSTLTDAYQMIAPTTGGLFASVVNAEGREFVFFQDENDHLCYYLSDEDTETGYTIVQTEWCGEFYGVKTAIAPGGEVLVLLSHRPRGDKNALKIVFLRETFSGSGRLTCDEDLRTGFPDMGFDLISEKGVVSYISRQLLSEKTCNMQFFRRIYMGTAPGRKMFVAMGEEKFYSNGPHLLYGEDPNRPDMVLVPCDNRNGKIRIVMYPFDSNPEVYTIPMPDCVKGAFYVHDARVLRTSDWRNHLILRITYSEGDIEIPCLAELISDTHKSRFVQSSLIWADSTRNLFLDAMDAVLVGDQIHILLHGVDKTLQHLSIPANNALLQIEDGIAREEAKQIEPLPIASDTVNGHFSVTAGHHATVVYQSYDDMVHKLELDPKGDIWDEEAIGAADEHKLCEIRAYSTHVRVLNPDGSDCQNEKVQVWSDSYLHVEINGTFHDIGPEKRVEISTDAMGTFTLTHEANALGESDIYFNAPGFMKYGEKYTLRSCETFRSRFEKLTADELRNARKANGDYLLPEKYRNEESTKAISQAVQDLMREGGSNTFYNGSTAFAVKMINDQPCYRQLQPNEADAIVEQWKKDGSKNIFARIADFFRAVGRGIAKVTESIFTKVKEGIKAAFNFVLDGVKYVMETVIKVAQQVFDAVEVIFSKVMVLFIDLFDWLGDPFDWKGLARTKKAIEGVLQCGVKLIGKNIDTQRKWMNDGFKKVISELDQAINQACERLGGVNMSSFEKNAMAHGGEGIYKINNTVLDTFLANSQKIGLDDDSLEARLDGILTALDVSKLFDTIKEQADDIWNREEVQAAIERLKEKLQNREAMSSFKLSDLLLILKDIIIILLGCMNGTLNLIFDWMERMLNAFVALLELRLRIPFLGALYSAKYNEKLTLGGLCSLLFAAVIHPAYKLTQGKPLFADDAALENFLRKVEEMTDAPIGSVNSVDEETLRYLSRLCDGCQVAVYLFTVIFDDPSSTRKAPPSVNWHTLTIKSILAVTGICWQVFCYPNWAGDADEKSNILWSITTVVILISVLQIAQIYFYPEVNTIAGDVFNGIYTVGGIILFICTCVFHFVPDKKWDEKEWYDILNDLLICASPTTRFLLISAVLDASYEITLFVAIGIDLIIAAAGFARLMLKNRESACTVGSVLYAN